MDATPKCSRLILTWVETVISSPHGARRRYLAEQIERDLVRKMVFVAGPRQVGKSRLGAASFRDVDGREVDFVVTEDRTPMWLVECKLADRPIDQPLRYLKVRFPAAEAFQLAAAGSRDYPDPGGDSRHARPRLSADVDLTVSTICRR